MPTFFYATDEEIKKGETTDTYFIGAEEILKRKGMENVNVVAEVTSGGLPRNWPWGTLCGVEEVAHLLEGYPVNVYALPEGTIFRTTDCRGFRLPVLNIEGPYAKFAVLETAMLGLLCQASGVATMASRIRKAAGKRLLISFGIRRMHPAISPMLDRSAYIGGVDGVSCVAAARRLGIQPSGTMPHSLIITMGDQVEAWRAFDEVMPPYVPRIVLVDTYFDEKVEAVMAAEALGDRLWGVRLDTPSSRRGSFEEIVREVRWELDIRGRSHVKIIVSGGLEERTVASLSEAGADGFGVGTSISNAPTIDFALDIVEKEGRPVAKRGKYGGRKAVWRCERCSTDLVTPAGEQTPTCPRCGGKMEPLLTHLIRDGKIVGELPCVEEIRRYVLKQLEGFALES